MLFDNQPYTFDRVVRIALSAAILGGIIYLLGYLSDVLIPFALAFLLAYLIHPLVILVEKWIPRHTVAVFLSLFLVSAAGTLIVYITVPLIFKELVQMQTVLTDLANKTELAKRAGEIIPENLWNAIKQLAAREDVQAFFKSEGSLEMFKKAAGTLLPGVWGVILGTTNFLLGVLGLSLIFLYLVFLLIDYRKVKDGWKELIPEPYRDAVIDFVGDFNDGMHRYFRGQAVVAGIVGFLSALGFWLIDLPMGIFFGLFVGLLNMVPYLQIVSIPIAFLLGALHALDSGTSVWVMIGLTTLVYAVVQAIQDGYLVPRIMGEVTGLRPAVILLSLSIWGKLLGVFGLIIALPMTALLWAYYRRFLLKARYAESAAVTEAGGGASGGPS